MSKEKILAIIDTEFLLGYDSCYDIYDDSYTGPEIPYLLIRQKNGVTLFDDFYCIEFDRKSEEIVFKTVEREENLIRYPINTFPEYIDDSFLTGKSIYFKTSSLHFAKMFIDFIIEKLLDEKETDIWTNYILNYSNFIIRLLNFYIVAKCKYYKDHHSDQITLQLVTAIRKLKDRLFPIINLYQNKRIPNTNISWILMDEFGNTWESKSPSNHIINDQVSYTISLKNCKENPLFLMFEQGGGESSKKETYLVTYKYFENLIEDREFAYGILSGTRPKEMTPEIYAREMKNLEQIKEKILSLKKESLHRIFTLSSKEIANLKIESF